MFERIQTNYPDSSQFLNKSKMFFMDVFVLLLLSAFLYSLLILARQWSAPLDAKVEIDLSLWALPQYAFLSFLRGMTAFAISLAFTMVYGYIAAYRPKADRVLIPVLDILQSIPVIGFLPSALLALVSLFPSKTVGLELASILMIFTGQVWGMTFSFYQSLKTIPRDYLEMSSMYRFNFWQRFIRLELPSSAMALTWNSMMGMAGGWFFLMICESFTLGRNDFRLPGLGAYMTVAVAQNNFPAIIGGLSVMMALVVLINFGVWSPLLVWAQKFKMEEGGSPVLPSTFFSNVLQKSRLWNFILVKIAQPIDEYLSSVDKVQDATQPSQPSWFKSYGKYFWKYGGYGLLVYVAGASVWFSIKLAQMLSHLSSALWLDILQSTLWTFLRVSAATILASLWTIPLGIWIGSNVKRTERFQPLVQILASFPAPMLYPLMIMLMQKMGMHLNLASILMMMMGTQWYLLFNLIAGASIVPSEFREVGKAYGFSRMQRWKLIWIPAIFPSLVTGLVTSAGGSWNASIVTEYVSLGSESYSVQGLGSMITTSAANGNFDLLAAGVIVMALTVVFINRTLWGPLYKLAETKFTRTL
ncbi:MAG: ABC transporter permease subunit [Deltaproteobacteria bacterium]|nr:MAG: ABC transporter permease subunit [Deltaproteobacteria bacterium]